VDLISIAADHRMFMTLTANYKLTAPETISHWLLLKQVAGLWQRDRASSINDFKGINLRLNFRLKGYFSRHCDVTQFTLTYSIMSMFTFRVVRYGHTKCHLWHQKTRSRHTCSKCTNSTQPTSTYQIIYLSVLTTISVVSPSGEARSAIFEVGGSFWG